MAFLTAMNQYIKFAVSSQGCLGSHNDDVLGIQYDPTGNGVFSRNGDYLHQGSPWQMFSFRSDEMSTIRNQNDTPNGAYWRTDWSTPEPVLEVIDDVNGEQVIKWGVSSYTDTVNSVEIEHEYRINNTLRGIAVKTTIRALSDLTNARFATAIDPDPDGNQQIVSGKTAYLTRNVRGDASVPNGTPENWVCGNGIVTNNMLAIYSTSEIPHNTSVVNPWSTDPDQYLEGRENLEDGDFGIGMGFQLGDMKTGDERVIEYFYMLEKPTAATDETAPNVENLNIRAIGLTGYEFSIIGDEDKSVVFHVEHANENGDVESVSSLSPSFTITNAGVLNGDVHHPTITVFKGRMVDESGNTSDEFKHVTPLMFSTSQELVSTINQSKHSTSENEDVMKALPQGLIFGLRVGKIDTTDTEKLSVLLTSK